MPNITQRVEQWGYLTKRGARMANKMMKWLNLSVFKSIHSLSHLLYTLWICRTPHTHTVHSLIHTLTLNQPVFGLWEDSLNLPELL